MNLYHLSQGNPYTLFDLKLIFAFNVEQNSLSVIRKIVIHDEQKSSRQTVQYHPEWVQTEDGCEGFCFFHWYLFSFQYAKSNHWMQKMYFVFYVLKKVADLNISCMQNVLETEEGVSPKILNYLMSIGD